MKNPHHYSEGLSLLPNQFIPIWLWVLEIRVVLHCIDDTQGHQHDR